MIQGPWDHIPPHDHLDTQSAQLRLGLSARAQADLAQPETRSPEATDPESASVGFGRENARVAGGSFDRSRALERLRSERYDLLVIGGGITGAGVALDAASRGLRTALVEAGDFASGTSSRSSKLVHGGLRYVRQGDLALVKEALGERHRLLTNASGIVEPLPFFVPLVGGRRADPAIARAYSAALWAYDIAGGWRIGHLHRRVRPSEAKAIMPILREERFHGGLSYLDAITDDARLTLELLREAAATYGAVALNYARVRSLMISPRHRISGVQLVAERPGRPGDVGEEIEVRADVVVNATGVWTEGIASLETISPRLGPTRREGEEPEPERTGERGLDPRSPQSLHRGSAEGFHLRPAKGVHICFSSEKLPVSSAAVLPAVGGRTIFVVPWGSHTYVGTTDTDYEGNLEEPLADQDDVAYLLEAINASTTCSLAERDVTAVWAGLRPLLDLEAREKGRRASLASLARGRSAPTTSDLSRRHRVWVSQSGLVTVAGGKLTTYRRMASDAVDAAMGVLGRLGQRSRTARLRLHDHGRQSALREMMRNEARLGGGLGTSLPYAMAEVAYAVREEMAHTLEDVLSRRTRCTQRDMRASIAAADEVAKVMAAELGWSETTRRAQVEAFSRCVENGLESAGLAPWGTRSGPGGGA